MSEEAKLCKNCKWSTCPLGTWWCERPLGRENLVTGGNVKNWMRCSEERSDGECGHCARFYEHEDTGLLKQLSAWLWS